MALAVPETWQRRPAVDAAELVDPPESARAAGLRYVSDQSPGIRRKRVGKAFSYLARDGHTIRDAETIRRIKDLAIPPAWIDVWICPDPRGHLQATGRDARGRKQYRYHPRWREVRDAVKYDRMLAFAQALPKIRERTDRDLEHAGLPREKVLATIVRLLEETRIRIGNDEYRRENGSYGLTTLRNRHVSVIGAEVRFTFRGKSGKHHTVELHDRRMARIMKRFLEIPGQELFQYVDDDGDAKDIDSAAVNEYLREITGEDFTAKDFRTWAGTILAARFLRETAGAANSRRAKKELVSAIARVADELGNTPAIARKGYIHPAVIATYLSGGLKPIREKDDPDPYKLSGEERSLLALLGKAA
ncbi:MAG TPA: DNA topoisomerase IB [Candidatus Dormibacteraeota bacterium]|nr:DNA topoisomerase IB [Candidatus Dormibacteraeota bacterium]